MYKPEWFGSTKQLTHSIMKNLTVTNEIKKVATKGATNKVSIESKKIDLLKAVTPKKEKQVHAVNFKETQKFHAEFKKENLSLGAIRTNLLKYNESLVSNDTNKLNPLLVGLLDRMKDKQNYEFIKSNFLPNSKGFYSSYKLLMYFRKNLELIQKSFK